MEPEGSLPHSQMPATCSNPEPDQSSPCLPIKSNLHFAISLAAAVSEPALHRLLTFHVPILMSLFHCLGRTKESVQVSRQQFIFGNYTSFHGEELLAPRPNPNWRTSPYGLSATVCSMYPKLPSISEAVLPPTL